MKCSMGRPNTDVPASNGPFRAGMLFYLTVAFLLLEFGRPQELLPVLAYLHLPGLVTVLLGGALVLSKKIDLSDKQTRLFVLLLPLMMLHILLAANNYRALMGFVTMLV